jgi:hypothetical protein
VASKTLPAFALKEKWQGTGGMDRQRVEIEFSLDTSANGVQTAIKDKLPGGNQLRQLALRTLEHTLSWFSTVIKHLDSEFVRLTQVNILEEDTLILLSEEVIIMFDCFHMIQHKRMDFMVNGLGVEYRVCCIWISMQVCMVMDEFTQNRMKYNLSILAAFMRFLTKAMVGNAAAGVSGSIVALKTKLKNLDNTFKEVNEEAAAATTRATTANNATKDAEAKLAKLYQVNSTLKK